ncbi:MAG TPA: hypothetical protein VJO54_15190 [Burkholderiales bacterium]|nr:hypothetical protein [Burkholderiales bacterium]
MRKYKEFATSFWNKAFESLPPQVRRRHLAQLKSAERLELAIERAVRFFARHPAH